MRALYPCSTLSWKLAVDNRFSRRGMEPTLLNVLQPVGRGRPYLFGVLEPVAHTTFQQSGGRGQPYFSLWRSEISSSYYLSTICGPRATDSLQRLGNSSYALVPPLRDNLPGRLFLLERNGTQRTWSITLAAPLLLFYPCVLLVHCGTEDNSRTGLLQHTMYIYYMDSTEIFVK